jgi:transcriptional regulator
MIEIEKDYYLLLLDMKNSTKLPAEKAKEKFDQLDNSISYFNDQLRDELALPMSINYGDEIAGLFHSPQSFYQIASQFRQILFPDTTIRFVSIKGRVAVASDDIRQIGGSIFKKANEEMLRLKKEDKFSWFGIDTEPVNSSLTALSELSNAVINDMSEYQREVYNLLKMGLNQKEIAQKLDKYAQSVWDAVQRSKAAYVLQAEKAISQMLKEINNAKALIKE